MNSLSFSGWFFITTLSVVIALVVALSGRSIVVKSFYASPTPRSDGVYVEIVGRQGGLIDWLFALLGIDATLEMRIRFDKVEYLSTSLAGFNRVIVPIESVSSVYFGAFIPWIKSLVVFICFLFGAYAGFDAGSTGAVIGFVIAGVIVSVLILVLGREKSIGFSEVNGDDYTVNLKRSVIEGKEIEEANLQEISKIIIALLDARKGAYHKHSSVDSLENSEFLKTGDQQVTVDKTIQRKNQDVKFDPASVKNASKDGGNKSLVVAGIAIALIVLGLGYKVVSNGNGNKSLSIDSKSNLNLKAGETPDWEEDGHTLGCVWAKDLPGADFVMGKGVPQINLDVYESYSGNRKIKTISGDGQVFWALAKKGKLVKLKSIGNGSVVGWVPDRQLFYGDLRNCN